MDSFKGKMYPVQSSNMLKIGWEFDENNNCGVFRIQFKKGTYDYWPVSKSFFSKIFEQPSNERSKFINTNIVRNKSINYEKHE